MTVRLRHRSGIGIFHVAVVLPGRYEPDRWGNDIDITDDNGQTRRLLGFGGRPSTAKNARYAVHITHVGSETAAGELTLREYQELRLVTAADIAETWNGNIRDRIENKYQERARARQERERKRRGQIDSRRADAARADSLLAGTGATCPAGRCEATGTAPSRSTT